MIFSKRAPASLPRYDVDTDFKHYFFNDVMQSWSGLAPGVLTSGRNAKTSLSTLSNVSLSVAVHEPAVG